jgi:hypothetical protein
MKIEEEYSLFLEQVGKLAERRQTVTSTYLTVNTAIFGIIAFLMKDVDIVAWGKYVAVLLLLFAGIIICDLWRRLITRYTAHLRWWFQQLRELEEKMSESSKLLNAEFNALYTRSHIGLTRYENRLTWIFTVMFAGFGVVIVATLIVILLMPL